MATDDWSVLQRERQRRFAAASRLSTELETDLSGMAANEWRASVISTLMIDDAFFRAIAEQTGEAVDWGAVGVDPPL